MLYLIIAYFIAYITFCLWAIFDGNKNEKKALWIVITDSIGSVCLIVAALSYWHQFHLPRIFFFGLFVIGVLIWAFHFVIDSRKEIFDDDTLSFPEKLQSVVLGGILCLALEAPLLYWGFNAGGEHNINHGINFYFPWWVVIYLIVFYLWSFLGLIDDLGKPNKLLFITGSVVTTVFCTLFIFGYYNEEIKVAISAYIGPMLFFSFWFEVFTIKRDLDLEVPDLDIPIQDSKRINLMVKILFSSIEVPAYVFGLLQVIG